MAGKRGVRPRSELTQSRVRELFDLDYETGVLRWRVTTSNRVRVGDIAGGHTCHGYLVVGIDGRVYFTHRIVWLMIYGYLPENDIDHINRDKTNNAPSNLREVSRQCNTRNCDNLSTNSSGVRGISWSAERNKWHVDISLYDKTHYLTRHSDFTEAVCHRYAAEQCLSWNDCDANSSAYQYLKQQGILK